MQNSFYTASLSRLFLKLSKVGGASLIKSGKFGSELESIINNRLTAGEYLIWREAL